MVRTSLNEGSGGGRLVNADGGSCFYVENGSIPIWLH